MLKENKNPTIPSSYRGINILPAIGKIIDKCLCVQIIQHLNENNLIPDQHHGGIKNKSTITALVTILDSWTEKLENGQDMAVILLDQSAAYDIIDHRLLCAKMKVIGFSQPTLSLFESYLKDRRQVVYS